MAKKIISISIDEDILKRLDKHLEKMYDSEDKMNRSKLISEFIDLRTYPFNVYEQMD